MKFPKTDLMVAEIDSSVNVGLMEIDKFFRVDSKNHSSVWFNEAGK
ncbi:MAG: hypothetical protein LH614_07025 [Pyrinomonadaceae bacterium]|nr:hypothetical protein [Pyrinomonadaceae bacterium]